MKLSFKTIALFVSVLFIIYAIFLIFDLPLSSNISSKKDFELRLEEHFKKEHLEFQRTFSEPDKIIENIDRPFAQIEKESNIGINEITDTDDMEATHRTKTVGNIHTTWNEAAVDGKKDISTNIMKNVLDIQLYDDYGIEKDDTYDEQQFHYNIDDFGVSLEKFILSVENMKTLSPEERVQRFRERGIKTIFYMHRPYGSSTYRFNSEKLSLQGQWPYIMQGCRRRDCFCTDQKGFIPMEDFDAIVFHGREIRKSDVPKVRKPHQRYIFWLIEPPTYLFGLQPKIWDNFFNWTQTYRRDSDIWHPTGLMNQYKKYPSPVDDLIQKASLNISVLNEKTKSVAWMVSNCSPRSGRDKFVKELQKYIDVDVYGRCGTMKCPKGDECWNMVEQKYFFYFSAENSLCKDYVTEKLFNPMRRKIVPIAFGGGMKTNNYKFMPKNSFINALDFNSPKKLAEFLIELKSDRHKYASYFWWKPYYRIWYNRREKAHCEICDRLHLDKVPKTYKSLQKWFLDDAKCRPSWRNEKWRFYNSD